MARLPRLALAGQAHLVVLRGLSGQPLFVDDEDRRVFLTALRESLAQHRVVLEAYVLAPDHVHLLARPADGPGLSAALQGLGRRYVSAFNRRHGRTGGLVGPGVFVPRPCRPGAMVLQAMCFIDGHAWRAGRVQTPEEDAWCSAAHHLGLRRDPLLSDGPDWWALGNTPFEREAAYRQSLADGLAPARVRALSEASHKGWPAGDAAWLAALQAQTPRPLTPRPRGRPAGRSAR